MQTDDQQRKLLELAAQRLLQAAHSRKVASSSYDFVKIKVRLGSQLEHYYILSRFLLSRMLTVITLPQHKAVRVALDVKKHLVDHNRLDITQEELEEVLFALLRQRGYGDEYVRRYQMVTRFFQQKRPLIILIAGSACTGKSSLAQQLASRLNLPNVLQTDVLYELLRGSGAGDLPAEPLWRRPLAPGASLVPEFQRECATIRRALDGDLCKCIRDGKSIIIEGLHIDPGLFLLEFGDPRGGGSPVTQPEPGGAQQDEGGDLAADAEPPGAASSPAEGLAGGGDAPMATAASDPGSAAGTSQQTAAAAAGPAAAWGPASAVRRTASFGDAVQRLSDSSLHRLQSPWREHGIGSLPRPRSARVHSLERGQAVFMLQSLDPGGSEGGEGDGTGPPPPLPSPRPAISLPPVIEHTPQHWPRRSASLPPSERHRSSPGGVSQQTVPEEAPVVPPEEAHTSAQASSRQASGAAVAGTSGSSTVQDEAPGTSAAVAAAAAEQRPQHASVAVADATAAAAAGMGPVFVPICLSIRDEEYEGMLQEWLTHQQRAIGSGDTAPEGPAGSEADAEAARRLRALQAHLRQYGATGVPVVEFNTSDMGQALDAMHAYVLSCIELALN